MQYMSARDLAELDALLLARTEWTPIEGAPQEDAYNSAADILGYGGAAGGAKALDLDTPLPTIRGWSTIRDVKVGDDLFDDMGARCKVVAVSAVMVDRPCFAVRFSCGESVVADAEHRWTTFTAPRRECPYPTNASVRTTAEIAATMYDGGLPTHSVRMPRLQEGHASVDDVSQVRSRPVKCIAVDSPSRLFLCGRSMIPTHNTDLLFGLAHKEHWRSIIFRRQFTQMEGLEQRAEELFAGRGTFNGQKHRWRLNDGRLIEFGSADKIEDVKKYQGRPHDLKGFDELTLFTRYQFEFLCTWTRTTKPGQRTRIVGAFNPPTDAEGDWVIGYFGPWLDRTHPFPAKPGELRWYAVLDGEDVARKDGRAFYHNKELIQPKSRTFIPARVEDNPYLMATGYKATLQQLPEPLRSLMLQGSFDVAQEDHPWQVIPTEWIRAAQARWRPRTRETRGPLSCVGIDVARGGKDKTVYSPKYGLWFAELVAKPGRATPDGQSVVRDALEITGGEKAPIKIDAAAIGSSPVDIGRMFKLEIVPMIASNKSIKNDKSGRLRFANKRAEWVWMLREALDPSSGQAWELPPDRELLADLASMRYEYKPGGIIQIEDKAAIKERIHRSPDRGEALLNAFGEGVELPRIIIPYVETAQRDIP